MEQDIKKVHLFTIIYITIQWYIDNDTIDSSEILRTNQCWGIYPTIHSFIFFPIAFLSNLKVRDIAFCLPKHFLFQNTRVYRLNYLCFDRVVFLDAGTVVFPPFTFSQKFLQPLRSGELLPPGHRKDRDEKLLQWKTSGFSLPQFHIHIAAIAPQKVKFPNRKVGHFPLPSHHFSGGFAVSFGDWYMFYFRTLGAVYTPKKRPLLQI